MALRRVADQGVSSTGSTEAVVLALRLLGSSTRERSLGLLPLMLLRWNKPLQKPIGTAFHITLFDRTDDLDRLS